MAIKISIESKSFFVLQNIISFSLSRLRSPKYKHDHKQININATDPWSVEAVATLLRANLL